MGTSSINGGLSIATFDYESVHHIWFPWSLFPTKTYSEKLKKQNSSMKQCLGPIMLYFIYSEHVFFEHLSSWMVAQSNNSPFSMTHTHTWLTYSTKPMFATYFFGIQATLPDSRKNMFFFSAFGGRINLLPGSSHPSFRPVGNLGDTGDSHLTLPVHLQVYLYIYIYPLLFNIAMENGPFMDDFRIKTFICKGLSTNMLNGIYIHPISHEKWALSTWNRSFPWTKTPCDQPNFTKLTIHVVPFL